MGYIPAMMFSAHFMLPATRACLQPRTRRAASAFVLVAAMAAGGVAAQQTEVITLKHRAASDVVGVIKPLVEPAGTVSAMQDQLIVRTTPANLSQIRKVVAALDHEPRRLLVSVREDYGSGSAHMRVDSTRALDSGRAMQQVQVLEGGRAFFTTGSSMPVSAPAVVATPHGVVATDNVRFRDLATVFYVSPRLAGDTVTLDISARHDAPASVGTGAGSAETQGLTTTVSGRLGEWIAIGGIGQADESGDASHSWRTSVGERRILLRVEARN